MNQRLSRLKLRLKQYWIFLLWIGLFLLVAGGTAGLLTGAWVPTPTLLVIFGTTSLSIWATGQDRVARGFWSRRSTEIGTNALISTLAMLGILAAINVLGARYSARLDLTDAKQFTLAPESVAIAETLDSPVKVWLFSYQINPDDQTLLENYRRASDGKITFEYVDPQAKPGMVQEFGVTADGDVFIEATDRRQFVQTIGLDGLSEAQLSSRIAQLGAGAASKIYFLQGHGERSVSDPQQDGMTRALKALEQKNYAIEPLTLTGTGATIPEDAALVAIVSPATALFEAELTEISRYLEAGGRVLLTIDPNTEPQLDELAANWGLELGTGIAIDPERWVQGLGPAAPLVVDYGQHPITQEFGENFSLFPVVKPLRLVETKLEADSITAQPLAFTSDASWEEMNLDEGPDWTLTDGTDKPGPLILATALSKSIALDANAEANTPASEVETDTELDPEQPIAADAVPEADPETSPETSPETQPESGPEARLVVFGDSDFFTDSFFDNQLNGDFFLNTIGWLADADETQLSIRAKEATERSLTLTPAAARFLTWTALATFPAIGFAASLILWWQRR